MKFDDPNQALSVRDAAYHTVHDYPGGAMALGIRLGVNGMTLSHQVNPNNVGKFSLSIEKATEIQALAGDFRILHSMARELGHVAIKVDEADEDSVMASIADTVREFSGYLTSVTNAVADSRVTDNELRDIDAHLCEMVQQANHLRAVVAAMNQQLKTRVVDLHGQGKAITAKIRKGRG